MMSRGHNNRSKDKANEQTKQERDEDAPPPVRQRYSNKPMHNRSFCRTQISLTAEIPIKKNGVSSKVCRITPMI
jgi:hypothetical protein